LGNPVPDGTVINFISEGGDISNGKTTASCTTTNGTCAVTFTSAAYKPTNGRVTVLAYAVGEKSFVDTNGNNSYDSGETFYDLGDIYLDANESLNWNAAEQYISYETGSNACRTRPGGGPLPSNYSTSPSKQNTCTNTWGINYVRREAVIVLSGSVPCLIYGDQNSCDPDYTITLPYISGSTCAQPFILTMIDENGNAMPAGTKVEVGDNYVYFKPTGEDNEIKATITINGGSPVVNTADHGTNIGLTIDAPNCTPGQPHGYFYLKVTTLGGNGQAGLTTVIQFNLD
jgi:hypothetical protein